MGGLTDHMFYCPATAGGKDRAHFENMNVAIFSLCVCICVHVYVYVGMVKPSMDGQTFKLMLTETYGRKCDFQTPRQILMSSEIL